MSARRRRKNIRRVYIILLVVVLLAGCGFGAYKLLSRKVSPLDAAVSLPVYGSTAAYAGEDGFVTVSGTVLSRRTDEGREVFSLQLPEEGMKAACSEKLTAAWSDHRLIIINSSGSVLLHQELYTTVVSVCCGSDNYAVTLLEDDQRVTYIYKALDNSQIERFLMPNQAETAMGFCGTGNSQFWLLTLDTHYTVPASQLRVLQPGKALTANITEYDEIIYAVHPGDKYFHTVGTHSISRWDASGSRVAEESVYGWTLLDLLEDSSGNILFLMEASDVESGTDTISSLRLVEFSADGTVSSSRYTLPVGVTDAVLSSDGIFAFTASGVHTIDLKTDVIRFYPSESAIASVTKLSDSLLILSPDGEASWLKLD